MVEPGETVALTGPSGVGKSTLLSVVLGFTVPDEGRVRVGGTDLSALSPERWREQIAWVPQRPHLFAGTIADNVRLARPDADDAAVMAALREAGANDFVAALPDGAGTQLGEDGAGLSAGQRQRLALARAFLADRPLLLLDEPTASLDGESEAGIVDAVRRLAEGRTVLLVVHRPALLSVADRVVALEPRPGGLPEGKTPAGRTTSGVPDSADAVLEVGDGGERPSRGSRQWTMTSLRCSRTPLPGPVAVFSPGSGRPPAPSTGSWDWPFCWAASPWGRPSDSWPSPDG